MDERQEAVSRLDAATLPERSLPSVEGSNDAVTGPVEPGRRSANGQSSPGTVHPRNHLNDLTGNAWMYFTKTVLQTSYPSELGHKLRRQHYANKPPALMRQIVEFFTRPGQVVLDPFAGVGGTLLGASLCGRQAVGVELAQQWLDVYLEVCRQEGIEPQETLRGDSLEVLPRLAEEGRQFDAIITDPPYSPALKKTMCDGKYGWSNRSSPFESFSSSQQDFRNAATFDEFYDRMERVGGLFLPLLKPNAYAVVMIRDSYQNGEYIPASFHVAERFRHAGFRFKGLKIWYQTGAPVRPYGYPFTFVPNIVHHSILIFRKE
ncbi:MAG TPA: DNA methyltransferase [Chloroflexota bacterium]|nr:DNA methyltransferase [Chloroflexota bacterium]